VTGARGYVVVAAVVALLLAGFHRALRADSGRRNVELFTEMAYSVAGESFTRSSVLPDGMTQQPLVAGVVPRGELPLHYGTGPEEALRAGRELQNPLDPADAAVLDRGQRLFQIYCTVCHDAGGNGRGPVVLRGMLPPPSLHAARAVQMADGELFHILTYGQGNMASYAAQLSREERWAVILYVRRLQEESSQ
jgi:mono/diheme cytochrome c family protein